MTAMPMLWTPDAERGAAHAWGEAHVGWWVARRTWGLWLPAAVIFAGWLGLRHGLPPWTPEPMSLVGVALIVVVVGTLALMLRRRVRRGYRLPRRRLRGRRRF